MLQKLHQQWSMIFIVFLSFLGLCFINIISNEILGYPDRRFYYSTGNESLKSAIVTFDARYTEEKVVRFLRRVVSQCFSIDLETASSIQEQQNSNKYFACVNNNFARLAAGSLYNAFPTDKLIEDITNSESALNAIVATNPVLIDRNEPGDPLKWVFSVPITTTIQSLSSDQTTSFVGVFTVTPNPEAFNDSKLSISRVVFQ